MNSNCKNEFDLSSENSQNSNIVISSIKTPFKSSNVIQNKLSDIIENV